MAMLPARSPVLVAAAQRASAVNSALAHRTTISATSIARHRGSQRLRRAPMGAAGPVPEVYMETEDSEITAFQQHQRTAARLSPAEDARTLMALARTGVLSTLSSSASAGVGHPVGSVVEFAVDGAGRPLLATSTLSPHTADLTADGRCSLTVTAPGFQSLQDARFCLLATARPLPESDRPGAREAYLARHPDAFYIDFGDFRWFRLEELRGGRLNGGFARAAKVSAEDYAAAAPDPVAQFSSPVCAHMNADHEEDMLAMVQHYTGLASASSARMLSLDRLGMDLTCARGSAALDAGASGGVSRRPGPPSRTPAAPTFKVRLPFLRPVEDRKGLKDAIVEMTRAARAALQSTTPAS